MSDDEADYIALMARHDALAERVEATLAIVGKWCKRGEILLAMGELTPSELRCVQAATRAIERQVSAALARPSTPPTDGAV